MTYPTGSHGGDPTGQSQEPGQEQAAAGQVPGSGQGQGAGVMSQQAGSAPGPGGYGSGGYGQPSAATQQQPVPQRPQAGMAGNPFARMSAPAMLAAGVAVFSLITFFCSFPMSAQAASRELLLLLAGGLFAALYLVPNAPRVLPVATVLSVLGGMSMLLVVVHSSVLPGILVVLLILGLFQMLLAVAALLIDLRVIKLPTPHAQPPRQGAYPGTSMYPPVGGFSAQGQNQAHGPNQGQGLAASAQAPGQPVAGQQPAQHRPGQQEGQVSGQLQQGSHQAGQQEAAQTVYASQQGQFSRPAKGFEQS